MARKTVRKKSCASKRAYKSSGRCVPKAKKASTKSRGCWAKTRDDAVRGLELYSKRKAAAAHARAIVLERKQREAARRPPETAEEAMQFQGLHHRRRRRHGRR